jgi:hypothetical protein
MTQDIAIARKRDGKKYGAEKIKRGGTKWADTIT